ncbi:unnamed protein product [Arctogadus glacialis]
MMSPAAIHTPAPPVPLVAVDVVVKETTDTLGMALDWSGRAPRGPQNETQATQSLITLMASLPCTSGFSPVAPGLRAVSGEDLHTLHISSPASAQPIRGGPGPLCRSSPDHLGGPQSSSSGLGGGTRGGPFCVGPGVGALWEVFVGLKEQVEQVEGNSNVADPMRERGPSRPVWSPGCKT